LKRGIKSLRDNKMVTFASSDEDAFNLQAPIAGSIKDAQVQGNPAVLRSVLGYAAASRSVTNQMAFEQGTKFLVDCSQGI
jgi:hypothetical protein